MFKNWFKKKTFTPVQETNGIHTLATIFQQNSSWINPGVINFIEFYQQVEPLADAVDRIGDKVSEIEPCLMDKNNQFLKTHPVLDLIANPNTNVEYCEFMKSSSNYLTLSGNLYWIITRSPIRNAVLEIFVAPPQSFTMGTNSAGFVENYFYTPNGLPLTFNAEEVDGVIRYFTNDQRLELIHLKEFNPNAYLYQEAGISRLHAITYAILQYRAASVHNLALLENGARPSGIFKLHPQATSQDQIKAFTAQMENMFSGPSNAGRPIATSMIDDFISFMQSNADMDFLNLKKQVSETIYNRLKIPLVLISTDAATFNNYQTALTAFYDDAIIPQYQRMMNVLTMYMRFYDDSMKDLRITFDPLTIPALRERRIAELNSVYTLSVMSDNEIRNALGMESYDEGNEIWKSTAFAPVSLDEPSSQPVPKPQLPSNENDKNGDDETTPTN